MRRQVVLYSSGHPDRMTQIESIPVRDIRLNKNPHFVIQRDGFVDKPLVPSKDTAQIVVCLVGRRFFGPEQMDALFGLYMKLLAKYRIEPEDWIVAQDMSDKYAFDGDIESLRERFYSL